MPDQEDFNTKNKYACNKYKCTYFEKPQNALTREQSDFFDNLTNGLDTKIYYYGSIQRLDYFPGYSDIDVCIFSDNVESTLSKIQMLIEPELSKVKQLYVLYDKRTVNKCYKIKYVNPTNGVFAEISIYDKKYRDEIFKLLIQTSLFPFYLVGLLYILKFIYYRLGVLSEKTYLAYKSYILNDTTNLKKHVTIRNDKNIHKHNMSSDK
jgi:hypothetical protein